MAGFGSYFKSESLPDTRLVLLFQAPNPPAAAAAAAAQTSPATVAVAAAGTPPLSSSAAADPPAYATLALTTPTQGEANVTEGELPGCGTKRKAASLEAADVGVEEAASVVSMPAHKLVLMAKSAYFHTRMSTSLGENASSVVREHASSFEEIRAMESVVEFMYTDKLPVYCTSQSGTEIETHGMFGPVQSPTLRLLMTLTVADRWQVHPCVARCCGAIWTQLEASFVWEDCIAIFNLPEGLKELSGMLPVINFATTVISALINVPASSAITAETHQEQLSAKMHQLPVSVRLALLNSFKLGYTGMLVFLSSEEQVAESEDQLATLLCSYITASGESVITGTEIVKLRAQLRYQHMSNAFVGFAVPDIPLLSLDLEQLSHLIYLRGLKELDSLPERYRKPSDPAAWYAPPRKHEKVLPETLELTLNISEAALSAYLNAFVLSKAGGTVIPSNLETVAVESSGVSWKLVLRFPTPDRRLGLVVRTTFTTPEAVATQKHGMYVNIRFRIDGTPQPYTGQTSGWIGPVGSFLRHLVPTDEKGTADSPTAGANDLSWWKNYIVDGHVRCVATITVQP